MALRLAVSRAAGVGHAVGMGLDENGTILTFATDAE